MPTTFDRLRAILAKDYHLASERLTPDAPLDSLGIDSLGTVELLWKVEETFGIKLPPEPVDLPTLGDVVRYIDDLVAAQAAGAIPAVADAPATSLPREP
jgi:acyl carrier protein